MKKIVATILCVVCLVGVVGGERDYSNSYFLLDNTLSLGAVMYNECKKRNLEIVKIDIDLIGKGAPKQVLKRMSPNFTYSICCIGEPSRIKDIDLKVYLITTEGKLVLVGKDDKTDIAAEVTLEEPTAGNYMIDVSAFEMQEGFEESMGYFYLTVAHD
jgi:hypothetical protein